jgi:putative glutamine transport system substrate-binding protein
MFKFIRWTILFTLITVILSSCGNSSALPSAKEGTLLRKIQDRGKLIVGVRYELPTVGYLNPQTKQVEGFEPALAREIAAYIFGDASKIEFKEAITQNRIPFLKDGTVDVILGNFVFSEDRLKEVDGSIVYYETGGALMVNKGSPIKSLIDLDKSKKVGLAKGSVYIDPLKKRAPSEIVEFATFTEAVDALNKKQIDAISASDTVLLSLKVANPTLELVGGRFTNEYVGAVVAKGNPELLDAVNAALKQVKTSGKWKTLWKTEVGDKIGVAEVPDPPADEWRK